MTKTKSIILRFFKGLIAGAFGSMALVSIQAPATFSDIKSTLSSLALAGISGAISGLFLAIEKYINWQE